MTTENEPGNNTNSGETVIDDELYDWPMLASGSILAHTTLDALLVQAIFNPHILNFWEGLLDFGLKGRYFPFLTTPTFNCKSSMAHDDKQRFRPKFEGSGISWVYENAFTLFCEVST